MASVSGNNTITTLERLKAMPGVFIQTIKQGKSVWFAIGELVDLITGKADKPITGTDVPTDPPAYEGQICSVYKSRYPNILVGVKGDSGLVWRQVAISGSNVLPNYNNTIIGGDGHVIDALSPYVGIFCGVNNKASGYADVCVGGSGCTASGSFSATLCGNGNKASGYSSACVGGSGCTASGYVSACLGGSSCTASGDFSLLLGGSNNKATAYIAVCVGGMSCTASGSFSVTLGGQGCKTTKDNQVAMGKYNDPEQDSGNVLFMVGGGTSDNARSNVFTVSKTGVPKAMAGHYNVPCCKTGIVPPDTAPDYVGQEYLDAAQKKVYKAFGTTDASDWVALN